MSTANPAVRTAAYIDIENLCGTASPTTYDCELQFANSVQNTSTLNTRW